MTAGRTRIEAKDLASILGIIVVLVGFVVWLSNTNKTACDAADLGRKNSIEISELRAAVGEIKSMGLILQRIENRQLKMEERQWDAKKENKP